MELSGVSSVRCQVPVAPTLPVPPAPQASSSTPAGPLPTNSPFRDWRSWASAAPEDGGEKLRTARLAGLAVGRFEAPKLGLFRFCLARAASLSP